MTTPPPWETRRVPRREGGDCGCPGLRSPGERGAWSSYIPPQLQYCHAKSHGGAVIAFSSLSAGEVVVAPTCPGTGADVLCGETVPVLHVLLRNLQLAKGVSVVQVGDYWLLPCLPPWDSWESVLLLRQLLTPFEGG